MDFLKNANAFVQRLGWKPCFLDHGPCNHDDIFLAILLLWLNRDL